MGFTGVFESAAPLAQRSRPNGRGDRLIKVSSWRPLGIPSKNWWAEIGNSMDKCRLLVRWYPFNQPIGYLKRRGIISYLSIILLKHIETIVDFPLNQPTSSSSQCLFLEPAAQKGHPPGDPWSVPCGTWKDALAHVQRGQPAWCWQMLTLWRWRGYGRPMEALCS